MNDMVERCRIAVVGAIMAMDRDARISELTKDEERSIAIAVIAEMRAPSPGMVDAFLAWVPIGALPRTGWSAVIDAALADASPDIGKEG